METAGTRGRSRRQQTKSQRRKDRRVSHLQTVRRGGFEESQVICRLWDIVKALEAGRESKTITEAGTKKLAELEKQLRRQIRVEVRRYFVRRRRRNVRLICNVVLVVVCVLCLFTTMIGIDRVSGESMYPYLNHGDWIVFSRIGRTYERNHVVVFEKNGENLVKRIAGLPGDIVEISASGKRVVLNGEEMQEPYVIPIGEVPGAEKLASAGAGADQVSTEPETAGHDGGKAADPMGAPLTVMDGQYLVLGDNRSVSIDSRDKRMGTVSKEEILGRVLLIIRMN